MILKSAKIKFLNKSYSKGFSYLTENKFFTKLQIEHVTPVLFG